MTMLLIFEIRFSKDVVKSVHKIAHIWDKNPDLVKHVKWQCFHRRNLIRNSVVLISERKETNTNNNTI